MSDDEIRVILADQEQVVQPDTRTVKLARELLEARAEIGRLRPFERKIMNDSDMTGCWIMTAGEHERIDGLELAARGLLAALDAADAWTMNTAEQAKAVRAFLGDAE